MSSILFLISLAASRLTVCSVAFSMVVASCLFSLLSVVGDFLFCVHRLTPHLPEVGTHRGFTLGWWRCRPAPRSRCKNKNPEGLTHLGVTATVVLAEPV